MKTRILALAVALAMPMSVQAATLTTPEYHTFTQHIDVVNGAPASFCACGGGVTSTITLRHLGTDITRVLSGGWGVDISPNWHPGLTPFFVYKTIGEGLSTTFVVLDDTDSISVIRSGSGGVALIETITTPLPAALPLFAAGLGIVAFIARRRSRHQPPRHLAHPVDA